MVTAIILALLAAAQAVELALQPDPPVAGHVLAIEITQGQAVSELHLSGPLASWQRRLESTAGEAVELVLPDDLPVLLIGAPEGSGNELEFPHTLRLVHGEDGQPLPGALFWQGYLLGGFPAPLAVEGADDAAALRATEAELERDPEMLVARELLWRLRARSAADQEEFLNAIDAELAHSTSGRLALAAIRMHRTLGDAEGAQALARRYSGFVEPILQLEGGRWAAIIGTTSPLERIELVHRWLDVDPFSDYVPQCLQILAATYSEVGDHRSTALFGLMSLRVSPDDAMTLNGVALAMAEGEFELERGLVLAGRASDLLQDAGRFSRPPELSESRWRREMVHARAACLDTRGWLLTKLRRWEEARDAFEAAIRLERSDEFYLHLGLMLIARGSPEEARTALRQGRRLGGSHRREIEEALSGLEP